MVAGHIAASVKGFYLTLKLHMEYNPDLSRGQTDLPVECNCIFTSKLLMK
jgi:hypothetical protein